MTKDASVKHLITLIQVLLRSSSPAFHPSSPLLILRLGRTAHSTTSNNILHIIDRPERHTRGWEWSGGGIAWIPPPPPPFYGVKIQVISHCDNEESRINLKLNIKSNYCVTQFRRKMMFILLRALSLRRDATSGTRRPIKLNNHQASALNFFNHSILSLSSPAIPIILLNGKLMAQVQWVCEA